MISRLFGIKALLLAFLVLSFSVQAQSLTGFQKRFKIVRDASGRLVGIQDRTMPVRFAVAPYVEMLKKQIMNEQSKMLSKADYESEVRAMLTEDLDEKSDEANQNVDIVIDSLRQIATLNVGTVFANPVFKDVLRAYELKLENAINYVNPTFVAYTADSSYFYKRNVTYQVVKWGLDFAKNRLSSIPVLNTASHIIVQVERRITERRSFHQNMLLYYLENFKESELGLTHDEVNLVMSSIYESRIPRFAYWESNRAKANWSKYGVNLFYTSFRAGTNLLERQSSIYESIDQRLCYSFQNVKFKGEKVVLNLFDMEGSFVNRQAVAFSYEKPYKVAAKRSLLELAQLGLSFVTIPASIKGMVGNYIKSFYERQRITEGALFAHFEAIGDTKSRQILSIQYMNPFDIQLFL